MLIRTSTSHRYQPGGGGFTGFWEGEIGSFMGPRTFGGM
jgi:hypothetical protein